MVILGIFCFARGWYHCCFGWHYIQRKCNRSSRHVISFHVWQHLQNCVWGGSGVFISISAGHSLCQSIRWCYWSIVQSIYNAYLFEKDHGVFRFRNRCENLSLLWRPSTGLWWRLFHPEGRNWVWINHGPLLYHFADTYALEDEMSIEIRMEDVKRIAFHYGFELETERIIETTYTANPTSMMQNRYFAAFWTMRKKCLTVKGVPTKES